MEYTEKSMYEIKQIRLWYESVWLTIEMTRQILLEVSGNEF